MASRSEGTSDKLMGSAKETFGNVTGNERLQGEGKAQHAGGVAQDETAKTQNRVEAKGEGITGWAKQTWGAMTGNDKKELEGRGERAKADAKSSLNQ